VAIRSEKTLGQVVSITKKEIDSARARRRLLGKWAVAEGSAFQARFEREREREKERERETDRREGIAANKDDMHCEQFLTILKTHVFQRASENGEVNGGNAHPNPETYM
jgi:hypothetical protein